MATTAGDLVLSIRSQIPDPVSSTDGSGDGNAFTYATLQRWINQGMNLMAVAAPIIQDWYAIQSQQGMDIYVLPQTTLSVEQLWYDLEPCVRSPEALTIYLNKITSKGYYFGPHSIHANPRLQVWPCSDRTGSTTTLAAALGATDTTITVTSVTGFNQLGFVQVDSEIILYRTITSSSNTITNLLRGQGGTAAVAHTNGATVTELNIFFKQSRLPVAITSVTDTVEIPLGLVPLLELYVLSKVREAEQESALAMQMRKEFDAAVEKMAHKNEFAGLRQGLQVSSQLGPDLFRGRVFIP